MEKFDTRVKWSQIMVHIYDKDKCSRFDSANKIERNHLLFYCTAVKRLFYKHLYCIINISKT